MTPKELLYIEDALGHTKFLMTQCSLAANQLTDPQLKRQAQQLISENQSFSRSFQSSLRRTKYERSRYNGEPASNH